MNSFLVFFEQLGCGTSERTAVAPGNENLFLRYDGGRSAFGCDASPQRKYINAQGMKRNTVQWGRGRTGGLPGVRHAGGKGACRRTEWVPSPVHRRGDEIGWEVENRTLSARDGAPCVPERASRNGPPGQTRLEAARVRLAQSFVTLSVSRNGKPG